MAAKKKLSKAAQARVTKDNPEGLTEKQLELRRIAKARHEARKPKEKPPEEIFGELTDFEQRFCMEYIIDNNKSAAWRRAKSIDDEDSHQFSACYKGGFRMMLRPEIVKCIEWLKTERAKRCEVEADEVLRLVFNRATARITDFCTFKDGSVTVLDSSKLLPGQAMCIKKVKVTHNMYGTNTEVELHDGGAPLKMLVEHLGLNRPSEGDESDDLAVSLRNFIDRIGGQTRGIPTKHSPSE